MKKTRILVMDDEDFIQDVISSMLDLMGYECECTADGETAIARYREAQEAGSPYAAVIMDLTIPGGMGGQEAIVHLKELDPCIRAVVSSGYVGDPIMDHYGDYGFSGAVTKPFKMDDLRETISAVLDDAEN